MKKGRFLWSAYRITEKQKAGKAQNIKEKQLQNSRKYGLKAAGHYSYNILGFLLGKGLPTYVINPLHTNL